LVCCGTPLNPSSARSSSPAKTSITRTGLSSLIQSPRHSGNSVLCPRSVPSTKRLIRSPRKSRRHHIAKIKSDYAFYTTWVNRYSFEMPVRLSPDSDQIAHAPTRRIKSAPANPESTSEPQEHQCAQQRPRTPRPEATHARQLLGISSSCVSRRGYLAIGYRMPKPPKASAEMMASVLPPSWSLISNAKRPLSHL
jgi:hypothetical protein